MPIDRSKTSLKLLGEDEAVCYTTSLHVSHPKIKYRIVNIKVKNGESHIQLSEYDTVAYSDYFEAGDKLEVYEG